MASRPGRSRRVPAIFPIFLALGVVGLVAALLVGPGGGGNAPPTTPTSIEATTTTTLPDPVAVSAVRSPAPVSAAPIGAYRIDYEIVETNGTRSETRTVRRPYEAHVHSERDGEVIDGSATSRDQLWSFFADQGGWVPLQAGLHRAVSDPRPLAGLGPMLATGLAEEVGTDTIAGRSCRRIVTGEPIGVGTSAPTEDEVTELCIDAAGLVLHERWVRSGEVLVERTATAVELEPAIEATTFEPEPQVDITPEIELILEQAAPTAPSTDEEIDALRSEFDLPEGYALDDTVTRGGDDATAVVRFYRSGPELIEIAELTTVEPAVLSDGGFRPVEGAARRNVHFRAGLSTSAIRLGIDDYTFVELTGPDAGTLLDLAETATIGD